MLKQNLIFKKIKELRGLCLPLFFFTLLLISFQSKAQVEQKPTLETAPPAAPTPTRATPPAPVQPDTTKPTTVIPETKEDYEEKPSLLSKLFVGGSGDLGFSSTSYYGQNYSLFNIGASPLLGYRINKILSVGPGLVYNYYSINGNNFSEYGAKLFTQIILYKMIFLHGEQVTLNSQNFESNSSGGIRKTDRYNIQSTLVGGGYRQMASEKFGFDMYVLFNVANTASISNSGPVIRAGFIYNLGK